MSQWIVVTTDDGSKIQWHKQSDKTSKTRKGFLNIQCMYLSHPSFTGRMWHIQCDII